MVLLGIKGIGQLLSAFTRIDTPGGLATLVGSSLYLIGIVGLFLKKRWAPVLLGTFLLVEIISTLANGSITTSDKVTSSIINLVFIAISLFLFRKLKNKVQTI